MNSNKLHLADNKDFTCILQKNNTEFNLQKTKKMENFNGTGKVLGGIIAGALAGAALGLLLAPEKGTDLRNKFVDGAKDLADELKNKVKDEASSLRQKAKDLGNLAGEKFEDMTDDFDNAAAEATKRKM